MRLYTDESGRIKSVNIPMTGLKEIILPDNNPFKEMTVSEICCYSISVNEEGAIISIVPSIDSRLIDHFASLDRSSDIEICMNAIAELYEMITSK